jgi:tRNA threonylcarbamoyladenosine biosynthesis protein TsaE
MLDEQEAAPLHTEYPLGSEAETGQLASRLAAIARSGDVFALHGDLGAGKTAFARAFIHARGHADEDIPSPTFTLVQTYDPLRSGEPAIWHFDLFRIESPQDAIELGIDDAFADGVSLIEWPDRLGTLLPPEHLLITLLSGPTPTSRRLLIDGSGRWRPRLREVGLV